MLSLYAKSYPSFLTPASLLCPGDSPGKKWVAISFSRASSQPSDLHLLRWQVDSSLGCRAHVNSGPGGPRCHRLAFRNPPAVHLLVPSPLICRRPEVTISTPRAVPSLHCLRRNIFTLLKCFWSSQPVVMYRLFLLPMNHVLLLFFLPLLFPLPLPSKSTTSSKWVK